MSEPMTLEALLTLMEQWQLENTEWRNARNFATNVALANLDISAIRTTAQQHAAQLREEAEDGDAGEGVSSTVLRATADWLQPSGAQEQVGKDE